MSGSFRIEAGDGASTPGDFHHERSRDAAHDHVVFHLAAPDGGSNRGSSSTIPGASASCCLPTTPASIRCLPASASSRPATRSTASCWQRLFRGKKTPLKAALLDQRLIAGLGNIYVSEALWRAGLSPRRAAGTIATALGQAQRPGGERLAEAIRSVIADAIEAGGSSLRDYVHADGSLGYFQHSFSVYDREGEACRKPGCGGHIRRIVQSRPIDILLPGLPALA